MKSILVLSSLIFLVLTGCFAVAKQENKAPPGTIITFDNIVIVYICNPDARTTYFSHKRITPSGKGVYYYISPCKGA